MEMKVKVVLRQNDGVKNVMAWHKKETEKKALEGFRREKVELKHNC